MSLGATYVTKAAPTLTPHGLMGLGGFGPPRPQVKSWAVRTAARAAPPPSRVGCDRAFGSARVPPPPGVTPKPRDGEAQWIGSHPHPPPEGRCFLPGGRDGGGVWGGVTSHPQGGVGGVGRYRRTGFVRYSVRRFRHAKRRCHTPCGGRGRGHGVTRGRRGRQRSEGPPEVGGATRGRRGHQRSEGPPEVGGATRGLRGHQRPEGRSGVRPSEAAIRRLILVFFRRGAVRHSA